MNLEFNYFFKNALRNLTSLMDAGKAFIQETFLNKHVRRGVRDLEGGPGTGQRSEGTSKKRDQHMQLKGRKLILKG